MKSPLCLVLLIFAICTYCLAAPFSPEELYPETMGDYFEGDIILDSSARSVLKASSKRWPDNTICYRLDWRFTAAQKHNILNAMKSISSQSFVEFKKAPPQRMDCVTIKLKPPGSGCSATVGYMGLGRPQNINLADSAAGTGCFSQGVLQHEMLHTCGFFHQHNAPDRNQYITIKWGNIKEGKGQFFVRNFLVQSTSFGIPYDCQSIMHYGPNIFSKDGLPTIVPKPNCIGIGQNKKLSVGDIAKLKRMYPRK